MAAKKKKASVPLKDMLAAIDRNDFDFYARLDKDQKKEFEITQGSIPPKSYRFYF